MGILESAASCPKKSTIPFTKGSSGPTTTKEICLLKQNSLIFEKSVAEIATFSPSRAVPALPGAI